MAGHAVVGGDLYTAPVLPSGGDSGRCRRVLLPVLAGAVGPVGLVRFQTLQQVLRVAGTVIPGHRRGWLVAG